MLKGATSVQFQLMSHIFWQLEIGRSKQIMGIYYHLERKDCFKDDLSKRHNRIGSEGGRGY